MKPNPFSGLVRSRKVWLAILDAIAAILALWLGALASEKMAVLIMATWAAIQPVILAVIISITAEDKARIVADGGIKEALAYEAGNDWRRQMALVEKPPGCVPITNGTMTTTASG